MAASAVKYLGVVLIKEEVDNPWQDYRWRLAGLLPKQSADEDTQWRELKTGPGWVQYHAGDLPLELFRKETSAYQVNLDNKIPVIYSVLREAERDDDVQPISVHLITASPFEAQDYLDSGEEIVETLPMPDYIKEWVADFIDEHHEDEKFIKRQRDKVDIEKHIFGQEPIFITKERTKNQEIPVVNGRTDGNSKGPRKNGGA